MKQIGLGGISGGASVSVLSGGQQDSVIGRLSGLNLAETNAAYVLATAQEREFGPISETIAGGWNGSGFGAGFAPGVMSGYGLVQKVNDSRIVLPGLHRYNSYAPAMYENAEIEFRRVSGGRMFRVGAARMTQTSFPLRAQLPTSTKEILAEPRFRHRLDSWNRRGVPYWYAVAAVDTTGMIGAQSAWCQYVAGAGTDANIAIPEPETVTVPARSAGGFLDAPEGFQLAAVGAATVDLSWEPVEGAAGYVVLHGYSDPATWPDSVGECSLEQIEGEMPQAGDLAIWRQTLMRLDQSLFCARVDGASGTYSNLFPAFQGKAVNGAIDWEIKAWAEGEKPSETLGSYYLRQTLTTGQRAEGGIYWSGGTGQSYYYHKKQGDVLLVEVWMRASAPIRMAFNSGQPKEVSQLFDVGTEWRQYRLRSDFAPEPAGKTPYRWAIRSLPAAQDMVVEFAQLRASLEGTDYGSLEPAIARGVVPGQAIRDHSLIKTRPATYAAKIVTAPAGEGYRGWTCGQHMDLCRAAGAIPWVQLEWALPKQDWLLWAEWVAQNHGDLDKIRLELGNENWNTLSAFWLMPTMTDAETDEKVSPGAVNGMMTSMVLDWLRESPAWPVLEDKIEVVIGGHLVSGFGEQAYAFCPEAKYVTVANYNGGWDTGTYKVYETGDSFRKILSFAGGAASLVKREAALAEVAGTLGKTVGTDVFHDLYEAGPGYQRDGLNGVSVSAQDVIVQECVLKSRAAATAQLDAICAAWQRGWVSNWFILGTGNYWTSHNDESEEYLTHAVGRIIGESLGTFKVHDIHNLALSLKDGQPEVAIYAFESLTHPDRWLFAALNRAIDRSVLDTDDPLYDPEDKGVRPVTIHTGLASAARCRVFRGGLGNMRAHNRYPAGTRVTAAGDFVADPLCGAFDLDWHDIPPPGGKLMIDAGFGAEPGGLRGGNFILIEMRGVSRS